jgi:hypothetical protein
MALQSKRPSRQGAQDMKLILMLALFTTLSIASQEDDVTKVSENFIQSIFDKDLKSYKKNVSAAYLKAQVANGFVKDTFESNIKNKKMGAYDIEIKKGAVDEIYFVNFKEKTQKSFGDNWFILKLDKENNFVVDGVHHFED